MKEKKGKKKGCLITLIIFVVLLGSCVAIFGDSDESSSTGSSATTAETTAEKSTKKASKTTKATTEATTEKKVPAEYTAALNKAKTYSSMMYMSKQAIYDQLTSDYGEKFDEDAANYAMKHLDADWKANALEKAKQYRKMDMSSDAIRDQLTSDYGEKFTEEQADYAIQHLDD